MKTKVGRHVTKINIRALSIVIKVPSCFQITFDMFNEQVHSRPEGGPCFFNQYQLRFQRLLVLTNRCLLQLYTLIYTGGRGGSGYCFYLVPGMGSLFNHNRPVLNVSCTNKKRQKLEFPDFSPTPPLYNGAVLTRKLAKRQTAMRFYHIAHASDQGPRK